jgi:AcrR family transcriptional regulator
MESVTVSRAAPRMRSDARRNRDLILLAARDLFLERGPGAPLDEIARRAGVGIATLYRRFPDRKDLMRAVVLHVLTRAGQEARLALAEEPDAFRALARYMHRVLDVRIAAVMPALLGEISLEEGEIARAREEGAEAVQEMIRLAQAEGTLRSDVAFADIGLMVVRLSLPLPGPFPPSVDAGLAHRHLDLVIDGLRASRGAISGPLPGPSMSLGDLRAMTPTLETEGSAPSDWTKGAADE